MKKNSFLVFWDWNGTIVNDSWLFVDILNTFLNKKKLPPLTVEDYRRLFCFPIEKFYKKINLYSNKQDFQKTSEEFISIYRKRFFEPRLVTHIQNIIQSLSDLGVEQVVLSAQNQNDLDRSVKFYGLSDSFSGIYGVKNILALGKVDLAKNIKKKFNIKKTLVVGDTSLDYDVASALGSDCILVSWGHYSSRRLAALSPVLCSSVSSLEKLILDFTKR